MTQESTPQDPNLPAPAAAMPDVEKLADSDGPDLIEARAKLLEAQATLAKASTPLFDKIVIRGLIPIALAIVGPWALLKFDASQVEQKKQGEVIVQLQALQEAEQADKVEREKRAVSWRKRMKQIEEEKAAELAAMSAMVCRLDDTLKVALVQMAVTRAFAAGLQPSRSAVVQDVSAQFKLPGMEEAEVQRIAGEHYDRMKKR